VKAILLIDITIIVYLNLKGTIQEQVKQFLAKTRAKKINAHIEKTYEDVYDNMT
jgi:hypothetical protein